jgi:hypothetical protein
MNAVLVAWLLGLGVLVVAVERGHAGEVRVEELLDDPSNFDGRPVGLQGTFGRLEAHVTRKGNRYYTFQLIQRRREVLVAVQEKPACSVGALVRVQGRFDGSTKRIDAATVTCD